VRLCVSFSGSNTPNSKETASSSKVERREEKSKDQDPPEEKEKPKAKVVASFPPCTNTTDAVRLKCRELLANAIRGDGGNFLFLFSGMSQVWKVSKKTVGQEKSGKTRSL